MLMNANKVKSCSKIQLITGINNVATIAPNDETRVSIMMLPQIAINVPPTNHDKPKNAPMAVATPLPPLKPKKHWPNVSNQSR